MLDIIKSYFNLWHLILRGIYLYASFFIFILFLGSKSSGILIDLLLPLVIALVIIIYAVRIQEERYILLIIIFFIGVALANPLDSFLRSTLMGGASYMLVLHALRPWRNKEDN